MRMFAYGRTCESRHPSCLASGWLKHSYLSQIKHLSFWSPSKALLTRYQPNLPKHVEAQCIPLPLTFVSPATSKTSSPSNHCLRLLYVGQVIATKGVDFLLSVLDRLAQSFHFGFTIVGGGAMLETLQNKYQEASWVRFVGRVNPEVVADFMVASDLLLIPSVWLRTPAGCLPSHSARPSYPRQQNRGIARAGRSRSQRRLP